LYDIPDNKVVVEMGSEGLAVSEDCNIQRKCKANGRNSKYHH